MSKFHKDFPFGRGQWIWYISKCEGGNIQAIIDKCKKYNISYVMVKAGDGDNTWSQFNKELVKRFHDAGIKIYGWAYNYGKNPLKEAAIACWALDMGADGFVFDAESEWERMPNNAAAANLMLQQVRKHAPNAFLAHSPYPIIDLHSGFPYKEFGKYCDAVMPQMYFGTMGRTAENVIMWTFQQWEKWEAIWKEQGHGDSVKPIIPVGQTYDNAQTKFVCSPADIKAFMDGVSGYGSVNFWSWQHTIRENIWEAIRDSFVKIPDQAAAPIQPDKPAPQDPTPTFKVSGGYEHASWHDDPAELPKIVNKRWWVWPSGKGNFLPEGTITPLHFGWYVNPETGKSQRWVIENDVGRFLPVGQTDLPPNDYPPAIKTVPIPNDGSRVSVEVKENKDEPNGVEVKVKFHKTHLDVFLDFINRFKGGVKK